MVVLNADYDRVGERIHLDYVAFRRFPDYATSLDALAIFGTCYLLLAMVFEVVFCDDRRDRLYRYPY